jgi:predicted SAM-dependent methyltransferase
MIRLDIGSGPNPHEGFTGVDACCASENVTAAPMWKLPYGDSSVDQILSSHALEHIPKRMVVPTLMEWNRVLKPDAPLTIFVPDLEWCCRQWLEHLSNDWWMDTIFGNQDNAGQFHQTGFTHEIMGKYLAEAGFEIVEMSREETHRQQSLVFVARKAGGHVPRE